VNTAYLLAIVTAVFGLVIGFVGVCAKLDGDRLSRDAAPWLLAVAIGFLIEGAVFAAAGLSIQY
jgi:hypothetical protein